VGGGWNGRALNNGHFEAGKEGNGPEAGGGRKKKLELRSMWGIKKERNKEKRGKI
jgi:hypothetical protein